MNKQEVAKRIRCLRESKNMTQNALANQAGVSPTYINQLERGEKSPTVEYLGHICWGLGITLEDFFAVKKDDRFVDRLSGLTEKQKELLNQFLNSLD